MTVGASGSADPSSGGVSEGVSEGVSGGVELPGAGAAVELLRQATMLDDSNGPFGGFSKVADAHVSPDGATIATDDGQLVTEITWLGVGAKTEANN